MGGRKVNTTIKPKEIPNKRTLMFSTPFIIRDSARFPRKCQLSRPPKIYNIVKQELSANDKSAMVGLKPCPKLN